ncbi:uncharacterized protein VTP21DRAFT_4141 [Calcarisporiella thermophila]|uniref:uncharacterized protein n=1 Tax=Calcarisporiella thermophila TaxID=911321 RepID=UPI0037443987
MNAVLLCPPEDNSITTPRQENRMLLMRLRTSIVSILIFLVLIAQHISVCSGGGIRIPQDNATARAGSKMPFQLQVVYQDVAMLHSVQVQLIDGNGNILADDLAKATRPEWEQGRTYNGTVLIPTNISPGDYVLRVVGNETYRCGEMRSVCSANITSETPIHVVSKDSKDIGPYAVYSPASSSTFLLTNVYMFALPTLFILTLELFLLF